MQQHLTSHKPPQKCKLSDLAELSDHTQHMYTSRTPKHVELHLSHKIIPTSYCPKLLPFPKELNTPPFPTYKMQPFLFLHFIAIVHAFHCISDSTYPRGNCCASLYTGPDGLHYGSTCISTILTRDPPHLSRPTPTNARPSRSRCRAVSPTGGLLL